MPVKEAPVKQVIEKVTSIRKGRVKVIKLVQWEHSEFGSSRTQRVYEQVDCVLNKKLKRRIMNNLINPIMILENLRTNGALIL